MTEFFKMLRDNVIPWVRDVATKVGEWFDKNKPLVDALKDFALKTLAWLATAIGTVVGKLSEVVAWVANNKGIMENLRLMWVGMGEAIRIASQWVDWFFKGIDKAAGALRDLKKIMPDIGNIGAGPVKGFDNFGGIPIPKLQFANGGVVPGRGPQMAIVHGGETVTPAGKGGFMIQGVSERDIVDMVDRGLYFKLQRAAPTQGRV
jgi:hypothetical protein